MNKTAIKNFAIKARLQLMEAVRQKAYEYDIKADVEPDPMQKFIGDRMLDDTEFEQRQELCRQIHIKGYKQVVEEIAYTWFNRFIALRFMEVNGYIPSRIRIFTDENGEFKPEILKEAVNVELEGVDKEKVIDLIESQSNEELYKYLIIAQCNELNEGLPYMFEKISNWTELLFPSKLLRQDSVIACMVNEIPESDWTDQVQIIGWLYQFYNSEPKDEAFASKSKISKEQIPAVTQLFTPDWIVRYMVENSLGRLWYEGHRDEELKSGWKYYIDEAEQEEAVQKKLDEIRAEYSEIKPEEIKIIDPSMGSGHILVYAFDVLMQIYVSLGWSEREAAKSIVENNLYGLDIDDRASQLAYFAVMMKARNYNRRILKGDVAANVFSIQESNDFNRDYLSLFGEMRQTAEKLCDEFIDAKEYGSILNLKITEQEIDSLQSALDEIKETDYDNIFDSIRKSGVITSFQPLLKQAKLMVQKYDVTVTNPPYMAVSNGDAKLNEYVKKNYPDSKADLFAVFIEKCNTMLRPNGYQAMITQHSWMFLSSFENLRNKLFASAIVCMAHLGIGTFEDLNSKVVQSVSFVIRKTLVNNYYGVYDRLFEKQGRQESNENKRNWLMSGKHRFHATQSNFSKIPGSPVAYWVSEKIFSCFINTPKIDEVSFPRQGLATGNNDKFLRLWHEVIYSDIFFNSKSHDDFFNSGLKYIPYNKGGAFRKWFAVMEFVIRFDKQHYNILSTVGNHLPSKEFYFKESITWSKVTSGGLSMRYIPDGSVFDVAGCSIFCNNNLMYMLGFVNSCVMQNLMNVLSQTINYEVGNVKNIPIKFEKVNMIEHIVNRNVEISKNDLDVFESSYGFKQHPLV